MNTLNEFKKRSSTTVPKITTFHGFKYLTEGNITWKLFWATILLGNLLFTSFLVFTINRRFGNNQVYTSIDATCLVNMVPFPSIAICNENLVSFKESRNIENILKFNGVSSREIEKFFSALPELVLYDYDYLGTENKESFMEIKQILQTHYYDLDILMEEVHQKCENLLLYCVFNRKVRKCGDMFTLIKTLVGHCCAFNYAALNDDRYVPNNGEEDEYDYFGDKRDRIIATSESGRTSGLTVLFDVQPKDYPEWSSAYFQGVKVFVFDPLDFPETTIYKKFIILGESIDLKIDPLVYESAEVLRRVRPSDRGCWFDDETKLSHADKYSYETCRTECRIKHSLDYCGCVPYYYPRDKASRICEFSDSKCLKNLTILGSLNKNCNCHFQCTDRGYAIKNNALPLIQNDFPDEIINLVNLSQVMSLKVYYVNPNCRCYIKNIFMDVNNLIAAYGGVLCLSMGGSIIAVYEIIYLTVAYINKGVMKKLRKIDDRNI